MARSLEVVLENRLEEIQRLARAIDQFCGDVGISPTDAFKLNLALDELITNVILYGYEDGEKHEIKVSLSVTEDELLAHLIDDAKPFDPVSDSPDPELETPMEERPIGGLGVHLVKTLMDSVQYRRDGVLNCLSLRKRRMPPEPSKP